MKTICVYTIIGFLLVTFLSGEKLKKERKVYETQYATSRMSTFVYPVKSWTAERLVKSNLDPLQFRFVGKIEEKK